MTRHIAILISGRVPLMEQEVLTLLEQINSLPIFSGVLVTRSLVLGIMSGACYSIFSLMCMFCRSLFVLFSFFFLLSVFRFTHSYYPFGIFKLFFISFLYKYKSMPTSHKVNALLELF